MIPIVRIPGDFILTDYRDPLWTLIEDTVDNVKDIILMIYCDGQKDMVTIANYINDHDKKLRIKTLIKTTDVAKEERVFLDVSSDVVSDSRFQVKDVSPEGIVRAMVFLKTHFGFIERQGKERKQKRNDSPGNDIYKK
tara:strand:- start:14748 stop:15161 length:414 start_codon:yes stop_codon:yes gene_type:complete